MTYDNKYYKKNYYPYQLTITERCSHTIFVQENTIIHLYVPSQCYITISSGKINNIWHIVIYLVLCLISILWYTYIQGINYNHIIDTLYTIFNISNIFQTDIFNNTDNPV